MNRKINVALEDGLESECAEISIPRTGGWHGCEGKSALISFRSSDLRRIFEAIKEAEAQRIDPSQKTIDALDHLNRAINYYSEDESHLEVYLEIECPSRDLRKDTGFGMFGDDNIHRL